MIFNHSRWQIWAANQHPFKHGLNEFFYSSAATGGAVINAQQAMDWVFADLYPQSKPAVATPAALPSLGNTIGDSRFVNDDGDGKGAQYKWRWVEGTGAPAWVKTADVDWGADSILQSWEQRTQDQFVMRYGYDDIDSSGSAVAGTLAGQSVYGGRTAGSNLTLFANSGDGAGAGTGYVQFGDNVRPTSSGNFSLGTSANRFTSGYFTTSLVVGTATLAPGSLTDSSGLIDLGLTNLTTAGWVDAGTMKISSGSILDTTNAIDFHAAALTTTAQINAATGVFTGQVTANKVSATGLASVFKTGTTVGNLTLADGSITSGSGAITFGSANLLTTGTLGAGAITGTAIVGTGLTIGSTVVGSGTISTTAGNLALTAFTNIITGPTFQAGTSFKQGSTTWIDGSVTVTGGTYKSTATALIDDTPLVKPLSDNTTEFGTTSLRYKNLYLSGFIGDGTNTIAMATLLSLRTALSSVSSGMSLFYDGSTWVPSLPDTEITHSTVSGLTTGDAGHTQFAMLAGRSGGQTIYGGTIASENLTLSSTAHATKGAIIAGSLVKPSADNTYDLGASAATWKDFYITGQAYGLRLANYTTAGRPSASASNKGRLLWDTDLTAVYADNGGAWVKVGAEKVTYQDAASWTGSVLTATYTVDGSNGAITGKVSDARLAVWVLKDNTNNFKQVLCDITATATTVTITVGDYLPAGTYTLVGVG